MTGTVFNIQRYSVHDGPGIRTTAFLKGCPLSCTWCHNPEGLNEGPELVFVRDRCVGCGACVEACPNPPVRDDSGRLVPDRSCCLRCGSCVEACAGGARRMVGSEMTTEELLDAVERDRPFFEATGGGVTFSGGEPFEQYDFLLACLGGCRERRIHTVVDTSGYTERERLLSAAALTDLFLYDLKLLDDEAHQKLTSAPLAPVLENLRALDESGAELWVRFPLIPGVTDGKENVAALGRTVAQLRTDRVHVLPFHRTAADKYSRIDRRWEHGGMGGVDDAALRAAVETLSAMGLDVHVGG